ncbi:MAG TPA: aminotransferase class I/II-fold pyridoxal phosphate-dependent enzyme [Thermoanaerobaculia bacterium]|nr:aminotransferase class I/II-fold pyridoxal phosphate-dependent enzyme [Thermoanaerobaculia bacterium]
MDPSAHAFSTLAIHGGLAADPTTGAILTPIYQTTTYVQEAVGQDKGLTYSRSGNPTVAALERNLGALEGALPAACFATGMAALTALCLALLRAGDRVVVGDVVYGGTIRLLRQVLGPFGVHTTVADTSRLDRLEAALAAGAPGGSAPARLLLIESPGNPTLKLTDLAAAARLAHAAGALLAVDNTLLTPALQRLLELGADLVVHSTTKYIEGHNATLGGAVLARDPDLAERVRFVQNAIGCSQSPLEAWLTLRGIKTLAMRMERHSASALEVARSLVRHPRVTRVSYPGLDDFPQAELARRQQRAGGGLIAFEVEGGLEGGIRTMNTVRLCALAENLGAAETARPRTAVRRRAPPGAAGGAVAPCSPEEVSWTHRLTPREEADIVTSAFGGDMR